MFICAEPIPDYEPDFPPGIEMPIKMNPACKSCEGVDKIATRQVQIEDLPSLDRTLHDSNCLDSTTRPDMMGLGTTCLNATSMNTFTADSPQGNSDKPRRTSLFPQWTCTICHTDIPLGQTWQQAMHMN